MGSYWESSQTPSRQTGFFWHEGSLESIWMHMVTPQRSSKPLSQAAVWLLCMAFCLPPFLQSQQLSLTKVQSSSWWHGLCKSSLPAIGGDKRLLLLQPDPHRMSWTKMAIKAITKIFGITHPPVFLRLLLSGLVLRVHLHHVFFAWRPLWVDCEISWFENL